MTAVSISMAKKSSGNEEGRPNRRTAAVQIEKDLARMAAVIASHRGITQSDLCSPVLRPFLIAQYALVKREIEQELKDQEEG